MPTYVMEQCANGQVLVIQVASYNQQYGGRYSGGHDMLHDPFFWMLLMGPRYVSSPVYAGYARTPAYRSYQPSPYVRGHITTVQQYGPAKAMTLYQPNPSRNPAIGSRPQAATPPKPGVSTPRASSSRSSRHRRR